MLLHNLFLALAANLTAFSFDLSLGSYERLVESYDDVREGLNDWDDTQDRWPEAVTDDLTTFMTAIEFDEISPNQIRLQAPLLADQMEIVAESFRLSEAA